MVTGASKKSRGGKGTQSRAPKATKPEAEEPVVEEPVVEAPQTDSVEDTTPPLVPEDPAFLAQEWLAVSSQRLGYKPWIVRAAVQGLPETRKYTEYEIRGLIQRKLSEPA